MTLNNSISSHFKNSDRTTTSRASWLKRFLKAGAFLKLPAADLQHFVAQLQEIPVRCGQNIVTQCAKASHYYIIKEGRGKVTRRNNNQNVDLAVISTGEGFGEDAIISQQQRNATVTMLEAGSVMRIPADSFMSLIVSPIIKSLSYEDALTESFPQKILIDVRSNERYSSSGLRNSINIPLLLMRSNIQNLSHDKTYILYCDNGQASAAAAFILTQEGFTAQYIEGGLASKSTSKKENNKQSNTLKSQIRSNSVLIKNEDAFEEVDIDIEAEIANIQSQLESLSDIEEAIENKTNKPMEENLLWTSIPLPETNIPEGEEINDNLSHGWVNDATLWDNMLGYRSDPKIEQLLEAHEEIILDKDEDPSIPQLPRKTRDTINAKHEFAVAIKPQATQIQTKKSSAVLKYSAISIILVLSVVGAYSLFLDTETKQSFNQEFHTLKNSIVQDANNFIKDSTTFSTQSANTTVAASIVDQKNKTMLVELKKKQAALLQSKKDGAAELKRKLALKAEQPIILQAHTIVENTRSNTPAITDEPTPIEDQVSDQALIPEVSTISEAITILNQPEAGTVPLTRWKPEAATSFSEEGKVFSPEL